MKILVTGGAGFIGAYNSKIDKFRLQGFSGR